MTEYVSHLEGRKDLAPSTRERTYYSLVRLWRYMKKKNLGPKAMARKLQRYVDHLIDDGLAASTIDRHIQHALRWLRHEGHEPADVHLPAVGRTIRPGQRPYHEDKVRQLLIRAKGRPYEVCIYLCLYAGMRIGEVLLMTWADIDMDGRLLVVTGGKSKDNRAIPIAGPLHEFLERWRATHPHTTYVYEAKGGGPIKRSKGLMYMGEVSGWHALRRTFATRLVEAGVHMSKIATLMGHCSVATTQRYIYGEISPEDLSAALDW